MKHIINKILEWFENEDSPYIKLLAITIAIAVAIWAIQNGIEIMSAM